MIALAGFHFRTIARGRSSLVAVIGFAMATGIVALLGLDSFRQLGLGAVSPAAVAVLNVALLLPTALGALIGALTVTAGRETGLLAMIRARGLSIAGLIGAAWLAVTGVAWLALVAGFGLAALVVAGNVPLGDMPAFVGLLIVTMAAAATASAVGVLVGTAVRTRLQAALVALAAWFVLAVGLDLVVVGLGVFLRAGEPALLAAVLANPLQAARVLALLLLDASGSVLGPVGAYLLMRFDHLGAVALLAVDLAAWIGAPLGGAILLLRHRDL